MADETFDTFFPVACAQRGASYIEARDMILSLEAKEKAQALAKLKAAAADPRDWQKQITAEMISGWMTNRPTFTKCAMYVRGDLPGPMPASGFTAHHRAMAIAGLGESVTPRAIEMVWKTMEYKNETESDALFGALEELDDRRAVMPMVTLVEHGEATRIQKSAIGVLSEIGDVRGLDAVLARARDTQVENSVRLTAIRALGGFDDQRASDTLAEVLGDTDRPDDQRLAAAEGLRTRLDPATRDAVVSALGTTDNEDIQLVLVSTLAEIGKKQDIPALKKAAATGSDDVKDYVSDAVDEIEFRERYPQPADDEKPEDDEE